MAEPRFFPTVRDEDDAFTALARTRAQTASYQRSFANAQRAVAVSSWARAYPHMTADQILAVSEAGLTPDSPEGMEAAQAALKAKAKKGFGLHSIGDFVKATARTVFTGLESPLQEIAGIEKNIASYGEAGLAASVGLSGARTGAGIGSMIAPGIGSAIGAGVGAGIGLVGGIAADADDVQGEADWRPQSTALIAAQQALAGKGVDLGSGFFSGGEVREEHVRRARSVQIGGHAATPGRLFASSITEPGTTPYRYLSGLVDAASTLAGDPVVLATGGAAAGLKARRTFTPIEKAGGISAGTKGVVANQVESWLAGDGRKVVDWIAENESFYDIWSTLGRKWDPDMVLRLRDARTADEVADVLRPALGVQVRDKPLTGVLGTQMGPVGGSSATVRKNLANVRVLQSMPGSHIPIDNPRVAVSEIEKFLKNAKAPKELVADYTERMAGAAGDRIAMFDVVTSAADDVAKIVEGATGSATRAREITRMWRNYHDELSKYFVDEIGDNVAVFGSVIDDVEKALPSPHLFVETLNAAIPLPDARAIRAATSRLGRIIDTVPGARTSTSLMEFVSQDIWKPMVLLRGAWTVRVVGEEQIRMAASGLTSAFSHPIAHIAWATGRKGGKDITGKAFDDAADYVNALSRRSGGWRDRVMKAGKTVYRRDHERFAESWADELAQLGSDPIARRVANGGLFDGDGVTAAAGTGIDGIKEWFWLGTGKTFREKLAQMEGADVLNVRNRGGGSYLDNGRIMSSDDYIDSILERIRIKTGDEGDLRAWVAAGKVDDTKGLAQNLRLLADEGIGPKVVKGDITLTAKGTARSAASEKMDSAVEALFNTLMTRPTNYLSRGPAFRQFYFQRVRELIPSMTDDAQKALIKNMGEMGFSRTELRKIAKSALSGKGVVTLDDADVVAKSFALDETRNLLYSLDEKSQFADITRIIFPFAEAWKEILTRWAQIGVQNPTSLRRAQTAIEGARGAGWFQTDPATGEEMFTYPLTKEISGAVLDIEVPFQGRVEGLNLFSAGNILIPGFGPAIQIPAGKLIPHTPDWDWMRDAILPFGTPDTDEGFVEGYLPAWVQKFRTGLLADPNKNRMFGSAVMEVLKALMQSGKYDTSTVEGLQKLEDDAIFKARALYILRGMAQYIAPSAPTPKFLAKDADGKTTTAFALAEKFRELAEKSDYDTAVEQFLDIYGVDSLLYMQSKSVGGFNPTEQLHDWVRDNPSIARKYQRAYGFFAPTGGDFSFDEMDRQLALGQREALRPQEALRLANSRVAMLVYRRAKESIGEKPNDEQRLWLNQLKSQLADKFPGFEPDSFEIGDKRAVIREMEQALAKEEKLRNTDVGKAIGAYLEARSYAMEQAQVAGLQPNSFASAKQMAEMRTWLRSVGQAIITKIPQFVTVWERVFDGEMVDDVGVEDAPNELMGGTAA